MVVMTCYPDFKRVIDVSDGEEENGDDAEMEADAEERGEGDDAAEKVLDQPAQVCIKMTHEHVIVSVGFKKSVLVVFRTARMRRWGTCSWLGRCWK